MELDLANWYLFPASIAIATIAMTSGIGGAVFFSPLFIIVLKLEPSVAIGTALITEFFGFSSGVIAYWRRRLIDVRLGRRLLAISVPAAIVGTLISDFFSADLLKGIFAVGIMLIGWQIYRSHRSEIIEALNGEIAKDAEEQHESTLVDATGREFRYTVCDKPLGMALAGIGGMFVGMISVGLAELQEYHLVARCRVPSPVAVGTSIFVVVVTVFVASASHLFAFATSADAGVLDQVLNVVVFTIPGVVIGGQIGPFVQARVEPDTIKVAISVLFALVGIFMLATLVA